MSTRGNRLDLRTARTYAAKIIRALRPYCRRIRSAGSVRRRCPTAGDLDFVCEIKDLPGFKTRICRECRIVVNGAENFEAATRTGVVLSFYLASRSDDLLGPGKSNWGSLLLCRTGSVAHNVRLCMAAKAQGMNWNPYRGLFRNNTWIAGETEHEIFRALCIPWRHPKERK